MHIPIGDILVSAAARDDRPGLLEERGVSLAGLNAHLLSVDDPRDGIVIWGKGFDIDRVGSLPWLVDVDLTYWGDIDTHGFAILDRLRAWLPQTQSTLMDRVTDALGQRVRLEQERIDWGWVCDRIAR